MTAEEPSDAGAFRSIRLELADGVARLTLARPQRLNALDPEMLVELLRALRLVAGSRDTRVLVLTGEGRAFCAGVDLDTPFFMEDVESDSVFEGMRLLDWQHELILALHELPQPTIAAVNGDAIGGGGFGMAMACDMRFAVTEARFWMVPRQLNVVQDFGLTWSLQRQIGSARTMELVFSGRRVTAEEGQRLGFLNGCFAELPSLVQHVDGLAATIASMGTDATRMLKQVVRNGETSSLHDQLRFEAVANSLCFTSTEFDTAKAAVLRRLGKR
ncbi:MAG: hypothetical protein GEV03_06535 [Streptosporangiales bacterium]|nr:hypothetical protein [Streptosporangiales bacterium]